MSSSFRWSCLFCLARLVSIDFVDENLRGENLNENVVALFCFTVFHALMVIVHQGKCYIACTEQ